MSLNLQCECVARAGLGEPAKREGGELRVCAQQAPEGEMIEPTMLANGKSNAREHPESGTMLKAALLYAEHGHPVFPCGPQKKPLTENGFKNATKDARQIREWWAKWPDANIAVPTGAVSGIMALDIDPGGDQSLAELTRQCGPLPETCEVKTGRGRQLWFENPSVPVGCKAGFRPGLDFRGDGGYVIVPPSLHANGKRYTFRDNCKLAEMPDWLIKVIQRGKSAPNPTPPANGGGGKLREGVRNATLASLAGTMRRPGMSQDAILAALLTENAKRCDPPLPENEVRSIAHSIAKKEPSASPSGETRAFAELRRFSEIEPKTLRWLWKGRIPLGKLTLIAGDPGLGKSLLTLDIAARVSKGSRFPDGAPCEPGDVIILSAEDDAEDTIRPRLDAATADVSRVHLLEAVRVVMADGKSTESSFTLERDIPALEEALIRTGARLLIVDPVSAYVGNADSNANAEVRGLLKPLVALAAKYRAAVLLITHLRKSGGAAIYRAMGSLAFAAAARAHWGVVADPDNKARRLFLAVKQNLAADTDGLAYGLVAAEGAAPRVAWESEPVKVNADMVMAGLESREEYSARTEAEEWLRGELSGGPVPQREVAGHARSEGHSWHTVRRAADSIGVVKGKTGGRGMGWEWTLPEDVNSKMPTPNNSKMPTPIHSEVGTLGTFDNPAENKRHSEPNNSKMPTQTHMDTFEMATPTDDKEKL